MKKVYIASGIVALLPAAAFAQAYNVGSLTGILSAITSILNLVFPVLLAVAVFVIAWGIFKFILNAGDEAARASGRSLILWGVVGVFLMLSIWGLVNILANTFTLNNTAITPGILNPGGVQQQQQQQQTGNQI